MRNERRCPISEVISAGQYCEDYCSGGWNHNYNCGGGTITLNTCGSNNADKVCFVLNKFDSFTFEGKLTVTLLL